MDEGVCSGVTPPGSHGAEWVAGPCVLTVYQNLPMPVGAAIDCLEDWN